MEHLWVNIYILFNLVFKVIQIYDSCNKKKTPIGYNFYSFSFDLLKRFIYFIGFAASVSFDEERITTFFGICLVISQVFLGGT